MSLFTVFFLLFWGAFSGFVGEFFRVELFVTTVTPPADKVILFNVLQKPDEFITGSRVKQSEIAEIR